VAGASLALVGACEDISYAPQDFGRPTDDLLTLANPGGIGRDLVGLAMFVVGLLVLDTAMTASEVVLSASVRAGRAFSLQSHR